MAFTPAGSKNIVVKPRGEQPFEVQQFLHLGRSCQQVEGCKNMSGSHDVEEIHVAGLPARVELRLWRKKPAGVDAKEDARVVLNLL